MVRRRLKDSDERFRDLAETIEFNLSFCLELQHYLQDNGPTERALSRIKPRDPGLFRIWRYTTSLFLKRFPMHLDAIPLDPWATDEDLRDAERAVSGQLTSRLGRFEANRRRYVGGMHAAGAWAAELCYYGESNLSIDPLDARCVRWEDGFLEPHHPRNPWLITISRMPINQVKRRKNWNVPDDLKPDDAHIGSSGSWIWPDPGSTRHEDSGRLVTIIKYRCRFEDYGKQAQQEPTPLDPAMYHMACPNCSFRSPPQAESSTPYPPSIPGGCPDCGGNIGLVKNVYSQPVGSDKRMVICAPFSGYEEPFYEGPWEFDYPTFPIGWFESYVMPHRAGGQSDTQILKTPVLSSNAALRLSYETMLRSKPYFYSMRGSIENARGQVFGFDPDTDGDLMYGVGEVPRPPMVIQGQGVNPAMFALYDRLQNVFRTNESTSELALSPSEVKEAKVGTVEQVTQTGNVVLDDRGQVVYDQESLLATCMAQALRELPSKQQRFQDPAGQWQFRNLGGPLMPRVEMRVGSANFLDSIDQEDLQAYMQLSSLPPGKLRGFAKFAHIAPEVVGQVEADQAAMPVPTPVPTGPQGSAAPPMPVPSMNGGM